MKIKINRKLLVAILTSIITFLIAFYLNVIKHNDGIYSSLFFLPLIIVGLWYYRYVVPLAVIYMLQFYILDFISYGSITIDQIIRGLVMIMGSVIMYNLGQKLNKKNKELKIGRNTLAIEKEHLRITLQSIGDGVISTDYNGNVTMLNEVAKNLTGWLGDTAVGRPFAEVFEIINEFSREKGENIVKIVLESEKTLELDNHTILISKDGIERLVEDSAAPIRDGNGNIHGVILIFRDVTELKKAEDALRFSEKKYSSYIENAPDGVFVLDENGQYIEVNRPASEMTGYSKDELLKMTIRDLLTEESQEAGRDHFNKLLEKGLARRSLQHKHKDGTKRWFSIDAVKLTNHRILGFAKDVTLQKKTEDELSDLRNNLESIVQQKTAELLITNKELVIQNEEKEKRSAELIIANEELVFQNEEKEKRSAELVNALNMSFHDQLTGLNNRRFYEEELKRLDTMRNLPLTIVMGDVNGLKHINDSLGHSMGDELLKKAAEVIKKGCRTDDIIARLGGDEFVILLPKTDSFIAEQILKRINELSSKEKVGNSGVSIAFGYKTKNRKDEKIQEIFNQAEDQMYINKRSTI